MLERRLTPFTKSTYKHRLAPLPVTPGLAVCLPSEKFLTQGGADLYSNASMFHVATGVPVADTVTATPLPTCLGMWLSLCCQV